MPNSSIAEIFRDIAQLLEIKGDNRFRIRAYERAAQTIEGLSEDIARVAEEERLRELPGIGADLAAKIEEYLATGRIRAYEELKKSIPAGVLELLSVPTIGPKTAQLLYGKLRIESIEELQEAVDQGRLAGIPGIKEKSIGNIIRGIATVRSGRERMTLGEAAEIARVFIESLEGLKVVRKISVAGSLRRKKETVRDIDILVVSNFPQKVMAAFLSHDEVAEVIASGQTKSAVRTRQGVQVDCRVVEDSSFGAALVYFTGSKDFNIKIRQIAIRKGLKVNEYGVFRGRRAVAGIDEKEVFGSLGMAYVPPEMREDTGEVELALEGTLPRLIERRDIRGDLHTHSRWSDGADSILDMARAAEELGYEYIALTDHSQSLRIANGLSLPALKKKRAEIAQAQRKLKRLRILYGAEVDIDARGKLDYPDRVLAEFDLVVAAVHSAFKQPARVMTERLLRACGHKHVHIIAHPTGRLWGARPAYDFDFDAVAKAAAESQTFFEINAYPQRLDLNDRHARRARELGARMAVSTDAHQTGQLENIEFGVAVARRAWLGVKDVINCLPLEKLLKTLRK